MPADLPGVDRFLGALGTAFRLSRLYPAAHPAMVESLGQVNVAIPAVVAGGTVEWKIGAHGFHWEGQQLVPRNNNVAEIATLLYARGLRAMKLHAGLTIDHIVGLFGVARGATAPADPSLGAIALGTGRATEHRAVAAATPVAPVVPPAPEPRARPSSVFRPDALPLDVEVKRAVTALKGPPTDAGQAAIARLEALAPELRVWKDVVLAADVIHALDQARAGAQGPEATRAIDAAARALADLPLVQRMVYRLGEPQAPAAERESLVGALGALFQISEPVIFPAYQAAAAAERETYRAVVRHAGDRALDSLGPHLAASDAAVISAAAELLGASGAPAAVGLLTPFLRHGSPRVRHAVATALGEIGGWEISRPLMLALKDETPGVRAAAARAIGLAGDPAAATVLVRRVEVEESEEVQAELLRALGRIEAPEALGVLSRFAEPGGMLKRRSVEIRAAAVDGLAYLTDAAAKAVVQSYSHDKEPAVRQAAKGL